MPDKETAALTSNVAVLPLNPMNAIRELDLAPGQRYCLHVPNFRDAQALAAALAPTAKLGEGLIEVASIPMPSSRVKEFFRPSSTVRWLSSRLGSTHQYAAQLIESLPVPVNERLSANAYNPLRFLGFIAAAHGRPSILIYETSGMDPLGRKLLHEFAAHHYRCGVLVHHTTVGLPDCDLAENCRELNW